MRASDPFDDRGVRTEDFIVAIVVFAGLVVGGAVLAACCVFGPF